ncbi:MAG: hypothetical protein KDB14_07680 [Planctomycetales bacterium]|nr:hypothetical protein [Planctomycetales bacterium]
MCRPSFPTRWGAPTAYTLQLSLVLLACLSTTSTSGQQPEGPPAPTAQATRPATPSTPSSATQSAPSSATPSSLPSSAGQIWREYDIAPYTSRLTGDAPQQVVVDWVLTETGTQLWFGEPLGVLSASRDKLRVYHTPQVQTRVAAIVQRLIASVTQTEAVQLKLCTIANPNWRTKALRMLQPVPVQSPGVDAWLLTKEDAAQLIGELSRRMDYREHSSTEFQVPMGQPRTVSKVTPRTYVRSVQPNSVFGVSPVHGTIQEGYTLSVSPLLTADGLNVDAVVRCEVEQVERLVGIPIDAAGGTQRLQIEVPQLVSWKLNERFIWRKDQVLLLSCGVVAQPGPERAGMLARLPLPLPKGGAGRADALLFVEVAAAGGLLPSPGSATAAGFGSLPR